MALLVGLGNVGAEYEGTRHNIGFDIVDRLAHKLGSTFQPGEGSFVVAEARYKGQNLFLIKPTNYMNNSGSSVTKAMAQFNQKPDQSLIIGWPTSWAALSNQVKVPLSLQKHDIRAKTCF